MTESMTNVRPRGLRGRTLHLLMLPLLTAASAVFAGSASAQDVTYTTVTETEFGGALGTLMNFVPGGDNTVEETIFIKDSWVRTDGDESSIVMDYATGTMLFEDHKNKTYYTLTLDQMLGMVDSMTARAAEDRQDMTNSSAEPDGSEAEIQFDFDMSTDGSGKRAEILGYDARQTILTLQVEAEGETEDGETILLGDMVMVTDQWTSKDFPAYAAMKRMREDYSGEMSAVADRFLEAETGIAAAFAHDSRFQAAVERNREELEELDGMPVKSTSYFVLVPAGAELDKDAVLAMEGTPISEGLGSVMGQAAAKAAEEGAKDAIKSRLGGLFGGGGDKKEEEAEPEVAAPTASILIRTTVTTKDASETTLDAALFGPREGYTEEVPEHMKAFLGG